jgi:hypothetical protein
MAFVSDAIGLYEGWINPEARPIFFVCRKAFKTEQGQRAIACTLGGKIISVVDTAILCHEVHPPAAELLEGMDLARVNNIANNACNHRLRYLRALSISRVSELSARRQRLSIAMFRSTVMRQKFPSNGEIERPGRCA